MKVRMFCVLLPSLVLFGCAQPVAPVQVGTAEAVADQINSLADVHADSRERDVSVTFEVKQRGGAAYREEALVNTLYDGHYGAAGGSSWVGLNDRTGIAPHAGRDQAQATETQRQRVIKKVDGKARSLYGY